MLFTLTTVTLENGNKFFSEFVTTDLYNEEEIEEYLNDIEATEDEIEKFYDLKKNNVLYLLRKTHPNVDDDITNIFITRHQ